MGFFTQQQQQPKPQPQAQQPAQPSRPSMPLANVFAAVRAAMGAAPSPHSLTDQQVATLSRETGHSACVIKMVSDNLNRSVWAAAEAQALRGAGDVADEESAFRAILLRNASDLLRDEMIELATAVRDVGYAIGARP